MHSNSLSSFWMETLKYSHFCGTMGITTLRCILSDPGNKMVVKTQVLSQPTDQGQCSDYKITHPTASLSTQMSWPEMSVLISSFEFFCCQKERQTCQKKKKCTTPLASLEDEWEHLQKYFTMSLFCERATRRKMRNF